LTFVEPEQEAQMGEEKDDLDRVQFLHEQRLKMFNTRREHEWRILFGVVTLILALDAAHLIYHVQLCGRQRLAWLMVLSVLTGACTWYEWGLQKRNSFDRAAMNVLYNKLCDALSFPAESPVRERGPSRSSGLWTFLPQMLVLLAVFSFSAALPWLRIDAGC
jgi:cbb3-type cytochrome oxidase subunit 3